MARTSLPPGFRFHPTDIELVMYHLKRKLMGKNVMFEVISELNICKYAPWDLPDKSCLRSKDLEWYFFCPKETKYANGARMNRATDCGYWKSTGKDRQVSYKNRTVGMVKTLVFHKGHPPKGERTDWVMHEYRMKDQELADGGVVQDAYVLCKVFQKSGPGPKNGAQYGAPFNEHDYDEDGELCAVSLMPDAMPPRTLPSNNSGFLPGSTSSGPLCGSIIFPGSTSSGPLSEPGLSEAMVVPSPIPDDSENIVSMLEMIIPEQDSPLLVSENGNNEVENSGHVNQNNGVACSDVNEIFGGLGDLNNSWAFGGGSGLSSHWTTKPTGAYLELNDLNGPLYSSAPDMESQFSFTDTPWAPYNCFQKNYCTIDSVGSVQLDSALNQSPLLPEGSNGRGNEHAMQFQNGGQVGYLSDGLGDWNHHR